MKKLCRKDNELLMTFDRIVLIMESVLLREGLAACLNEYDDIVIIATAGLEQAMATERESKPTTVVFEAYLPGLGSLDFVRKLWRV